MIRYNRSAQLLYLIFFYCSVLVAQQDAPPWLIIKPTTDSDKYVGIGEASTNNPDYSLIALFGNANDDGVSYIHEQLYRWIVYPWERVKGGM